MNNELITKYLAVYDRAREDTDYRSLTAELDAQSPRILQALEEMSPDHRAAVTDYLGTVFAANAKLLELSLCIAEKS